MQKKAVRLTLSSTKLVPNGLNCKDCTHLQFYKQDTPLFNLEKERTL